MLRLNERLKKKKKEISLSKDSELQLNLKIIYNLTTSMAVENLTAACIAELEQMV